MKEREKREERRGEETHATHAKRKNNHVLGS
jgi:hypothetical protein